MTTIDSPHHFISAKTKFQSQYLDIQREISLIHSKNQLKLPIIEALRNIILGIVRGAIKFENIRIIEPRKA